MKNVIGMLLILFPVFGQLWGQNVVRYRLEARMNGITTLWNGDTLNFWGFNIYNEEGGTPVLPGPTIECNEGDSVVISLKNESLEAHTIHLHGLDVDQANDGVPSTSFYVQPGEIGTYSFLATHAGNYLYHCHVGTVLHLQMGMYGAVIVRAANGVNQAYTGGPSYSYDKMWLTNEVAKAWHDDYTAITNMSAYAPDYFHVNGKSKQQIWNDSSISVLDGVVGDTILVRLKNMGYGINRYIFPPGLFPTQVMSDGRPLPSPVISDTVDVYPGERFGVLLYAKQALMDSVRVQFIRMYRDQLWGEEMIPFNISAASYIEKVDKRFKVYPNPFNQFVFLGASFSGSYRIYSVSGTLLEKGILNDSVILVPEKNIKGVFLLVLEDADGNIYTEKLLRY